jgi:hypothetical protein
MKASLGWTSGTEEYGSTRRLDAHIRSKYDIYVPTPYQLKHSGTPLAKIVKWYSTAPRVSPRFKCIIQK